MSSDLLFVGQALWPEKMFVKKEKPGHPFTQKK